MGQWLHKKTGVKFLFDMRGFWADEKVDCGQWDIKNPFYKRVYDHYKKKEKEFLLEADGIISLTQAAKEEVLKHPEYKQTSIDVIPCCADLVHFDYKKVNSTKQQELRKQLNILESQKVISYVGSVGGWYMTKEMFAFFKRLSNTHPEFVMLILTKDDPGMVRKQASENGISADKLKILYAGRDELPAYISLSECSIFFIRPTYSKIASSPTKHGELMGMGVPVICNNIGDTGRIIEETRTGLVVNEFSNAEYDRIIGKINELLSINKDHIRNAAYKYFDLEKGAHEYLEIYQRILN
jgi:glycosyltransferase involved in cell wall biosynthesis